MDTKKLAKIIKVIVEQEVKRQLPALIKEGVAKEMKKMNVERVVKPKQQIEEEIDPFSLAAAALAEDRLSNHEKPESKEKKHFTKNTVLNEILNNTQPFSSAQRSSSPIQRSVLDNINPINESVGEMDKTLSFDSNIGVAGIDGLRAQMAQKMGYGDMNTGRPSKSGLGVQTGVAHMDKALNRDYSELVKRFKK